jgi:hypothetical protein
MYNDPEQNKSIKRYATAAIIIGGGAVLGSSMLTSNYSSQNYGVPVTYNGRQYYIRSGSKRVVYPSLQACIQDVPVHMQSECEPVDNYRPGSGLGRWYGPVYSSDDDSRYRPAGQYPTETADSSNVGKQLPSGANAHGFGSTGKAFSGSKGG